MKELILRKSRLNGSVKLSGAKNSALKMLAASLLTDEPVGFDNYPSELEDAKVHVDMLEALGKTCMVDDDRISISGSASLNSLAAWEGRSIRNTLLILGALTAKTGGAVVPLPGGCDLGGRGFDLHELVLSSLGAKMWVEGKNLHAEAGKGLEGAHIHLPIRSTGATENAILCGCLAAGKTVVWNPHVRPEILDLIAFLNSVGANIEVYGQERIEIQGVPKLGGGSHRIIPDNMEALTWVVAAAATQGTIHIEGFPYQDIEVALIHLEHAGVAVYRYKNSAIVRGENCYPLEVSTGPHPSINSDVQPLLAALAACAEGESRIIDLRFPGRYAYAEEMRKLGVETQVDGNMLRILGRGRNMIGGKVVATDLRAGIALTILGLSAAGETTISDAWQISRGYNQLPMKLRALGADFDVIS